MTNFDPVSRNAAPFLHGPEFAAVTEALQAGQYGHNTATERFESELAQFLGVPQVVAVSSCTAALHVGLLLAGVGPGDEVVVPSQTFCATVQAILMTGAHPRFADIDATTLSVTSATVLEAITPRTRAVVPVLYGGRAVDLGDLQRELDERGITVVEDAAHAFGSRLGTIRVGATGALTAFSFGPIKNLTCGEGGALIPRTPAQTDRARTLRLLGVSQSQATRIRSTTYDVDTFGWRYHLSALHAAIGSAQLARFDAIETARKTLWRAYARALADLDGVTMVDVDVEHSVPFNCVVRVAKRDSVFQFMRDRGIGVGVHYPPNHTQPAFAQWSRPLPVTEATADEIMSLPFHPAMTEPDVARVAATLRDAIAYSRRS
ncbi:DegT/DnrJ/EryC1/StrS family aminotransferase [Nocardia sp. NBC_00508]|uniref:DegT/DnrJ/EryC1/StrS family aminotransferase n=1 Tax=Nocardia sp. NBC_00508 TaxID=2975992 RepID=UPI002E8006BB|nr:DegT/DnrJ/EryC1/StrS family aminotransferase [Nocardia sp. NBC_00508]WUD65882.1 DegT/DnrJ/EryC1/StrS family aminotransferase [Nocardia sp. NBC_00508]